MSEKVTTFKMNSKKYFAVDICNNNSISFHSNEEEAKEECLNCAEELHQQCADDQDMQFYEDCVDSAIYGLVLGKAESKIREINEEEKQSSWYAGIDEIVEKPEIVEYQQNNGWISVEDQLPEFETPVIGICSGKYGEFYAIVSREIADGEYFWVAINQNGADYEHAIDVTHWKQI